MARRKQRDMGSKRLLTVSEVTRFLRSGLSIAQIAEKYDVTRQAVNQFVRRHDLRDKKRG